MLIYEHISRTHNTMRRKCSRGRHPCFNTPIDDYLFIIVYASSVVSVYTAIFGRNLIRYVHTGYEVGKNR